MTADKLLTRLESVKSKGPGRWMARCPSHNDKSPSLSIRECEDGTVLIKCFAGCSAAHVMAALGLELSDLFPERPTEHRRRGEKPGHWHASREALKTLYLEVSIVLLAAGALQQGDKLADEDQERLMLAVSRIREAHEACI